MLIFISPAKTFSKTPQISHQKPIFYKESIVLQQKLTSLSKKQLQSKMKLSNSLTDTVYDYYQHFDHDHHEAITTYFGQVFKSLNYLRLNEQEKAYLNQHLMIISGLYGLVKPYDGIALYRLEMQDQTIKNLYDYWSPKIYQYLNQHHSNELILSLCSKEYEKVLENTPHITIDFSSNDKLHSMALKTLRGHFLRALATHQVHDIESLKKLNVDGFSYHENLSTSTHLIFWRDAL